jgi:hypothetical protein
MSGVQPYALSDARLARVLPEDEIGIQAATKNNAYYHALGVTVTPTVSARVGAFEMDASLRLDNYRAIEQLDEDARPNAPEPDARLGRMASLRGGVASRARGAARDACRRRRPRACEPQ